MRKIVIALVAGALALGPLVPRGTTAPALGDKPVRFEYGELTLTVSVGPPLAAQPGAPPPKRVRNTTAVWATADEKVEAGGWGQLADRLKAPASKREGADHLRVLNRLGADGWEVYEHHRNEGGFGTLDETWLLKRRLP
jgi:hypothetical protein